MLTNYRLTAAERELTRGSIDARLLPQGPEVHNIQGLDVSVASGRGAGPSHLEDLFKPLREKKKILVLVGAGISKSAGST